MKQYSSFGLCFLFAQSAFSQSLVVIDSGHDPKFPGAIGRCGAPEYVYNDKFVSRLAELNAGKFALEYTRHPNLFPTKIDKSLLSDGAKELTLAQSLKARVDFANELEAKLFVSVHHDSFSPKFILQEENSCPSGAGKIVDPYIKNYRQIGFNIFVNKEGDHFEESLRYSRILARHLLEIGRIPSNYHTKPWDDCISCSPIDERLGIWHQNLYVLKNTRMPAVLIEIGNIIDIDDERKVNSNDTQDQVSSQVIKSIGEFLRPGD